MAYIRRKYRRRVAKKAGGKRAIVRRALAKGWKKSVAKVCKKVISKQAEVKITNEYFTFSPRNGLALVSDLAVDNMLWCSPNATTLAIPQNTTSSGRIGNKIKTKRMKVKMILYPKPYSSGTNSSPKPQIVTIWCCSAKQGYVNNSSMATIFDTTFFQDGSTSSGYLGQLLDNISTINTDVVQLHWKRTYKLGHSTMYGSPNAGAGAGLDQAQWSNNEYKMNHILNFDLTKAMPKTFSFNDNNDTPNNRSVFLIIGIANADGTQFTADATQRPVDVYAHLQYTYTDM